MNRVDIIGPGRCGSVLLGSLLNLHQKIAIDFPKQSDWLYYYGGKPLGIHNHDDVPKQALYQTGMTKGIQLANRADVLSGGENAFQLIRDPRDVVASWIRHVDQLLELNPHHVLRRVDIREWANYWAYMSEPDSKLRRVMYEDLVRRPLQTLGECISYLGLGRNASMVQAERDFHFDGLFRMHATSLSPLLSIGSWTTTLSPQSASLIMKIAKPVIEQLGVEFPDD